MKKTILLVLALVMALSLSAPAMAFTSIPWSSSNAIPFELGIRLVEAENGPMGVNFTAPTASRGYLKNEIVCAVATLRVPKNQSVAGRDYAYLAFSATNVSINVMENYGSTGGISLMTSSNIPQQNRTFTAGPDGLPSSNQIRFAAENIPENSSSDQEYHFAFFGKVLTDNKAYMSVLLTKAKEFSTPEAGSAEANCITSMGYGSGTTHLRFSEEYHVFRHTEGDIVWYTVFNSDLSRALFQVSATKSGKSERMMVVLPGATAADDQWYEALSIGGEKLAFSLENGNDLIMEDDSTMPYDKQARLTALRTRYDQVVKRDFGLEARYKGTAMDASYFTDYGNVDDRFAEAAVEPWYTEIQRPPTEVHIPPTIEIYPPKTGDPLSMLGYGALALGSLVLVTVQRMRAKRR